MTGLCHNFLLNLSLSANWLHEPKTFPFSVSAVPLWLIPLKPDNPDRKSDTISAAPSKI
jgi:hypothetical protein